MNRRRFDEKNKPRIKKRDPTKDGSSAPKVNIKGSSSSQGVRPTCASSGKKHFGKYIDGTSCCCCSCKDGHNVKNCPTIVARGI